MSISMFTTLQELQAASSPSRRVNSPFRGRASPLRGPDGRRTPSASPRAAALASDSPQAGATASDSPQPGATASNISSGGAVPVGSPAGPSRGVSQTGEVEPSPRSLTSRIARISQRFEQPTAGILLSKAVLSLSNPAVLCLTDAIVLNNACSACFGH